MHMRLEQRLRHAVPGAAVRGEDEIRACPPHFLGRGFLVHARRKLQARVESLGGKNQEQIIGVGRQSGDQPLRLGDTQFAQGVVPARVGAYGQQARFDGAFGPVLVFVDDHEGHTRLFQFIGGGASQAAEPAHDVVPFQLVDHIFDPSLSKKLIQLQFDQRLRHGAHREKDDGHAEGDQKGVEDTARVTQRADLAIAHRRHGGQGHNRTHRKPDSFRSPRIQSCRTRA